MIQIIHTANTLGETTLVLEDFEPDDEIFIMTDDCACMRYHDYDYCICDDLPGA